MPSIPLKKYFPVAVPVHVGGRLEYPAIEAENYAQAREKAAELHQKWGPLLPISISWLERPTKDKDEFLKEAEKAIKENNHLELRSLLQSRGMFVIGPTQDCYTRLEQNLAQGQPITANDSEQMSIYYRAKKLLIPKLFQLASQYGNKDIMGEIFCKPLVLGLSPKNLPSYIETFVSSAADEAVLAGRPDNLKAIIEHMAPEMSVTRLNKGSSETPGVNSEAISSPGATKQESKTTVSVDYSSPIKKLLFFRKDFKDKYQTDKGTIDRKGLQGKLVLDPFKAFEHEFKKKKLIEGD